MKKTSILAAITGNVIEWYDFSLYIFLSPVIAHNFFAQGSQLNTLLSTFLIFAMGFFVRPLGALLFGHLGDRLGRATTLKISIFFISIPAIGIALLPNYQQWGIYAVLGLTFFRLLQGLCIGGEFAGSMIYLTEMAALNRRAFLSCMTNIGANVGVLCATLMAALTASCMPEKAFYTYGWRIPFILGGIIGLLGLWFRRDIQETPVFKALSSRSKLSMLPLLTVMRNHKQAVCNIFLLTIITATGSYVLMDFMSTYLHQYFGYSLSSALQIQSIYNTLTFLLIMAFARFSDKYGRRIMLMTAAIGYIVLSVPCFYLLKITHSHLYLLPLVVFYCMEESTMPSAMVEYFPAVARYTGISIGYNAAMALFGGTAPFITTWLAAQWHDPLVIAYYLAATAAISLMVVLRTVPRRYGAACNLLA